ITAAPAISIRAAKPISAQGGVDPVVASPAVGVTTSGDSALTVSPAGSCPCAVATLVTDPRAASASVTTYGSAVAVTDSPGARDATLEGVRLTSFGSLISTSVTVTLPVLVTVIVYSMRSPVSARPLPSASMIRACLSTCRLGATGAGGTFTTDGGVVMAVPPSGVPLAVA